MAHCCSLSNRFQALPTNTDFHWIVFTHLNHLSPAPALALTLTYVSNRTFLDKTFHIALSALVWHLAPITILDNVLHVGKWDSHSALCWLAGWLASVSKQSYHRRYTSERQKKSSATYASENFFFFSIICNNLTGWSTSDGEGEKSTGKLSVS